MAARELAHSRPRTVRVELVGDVEGCLRRMSTEVKRTIEALDDRAAFDEVIDRFDELPRWVQKQVGDKRPLGLSFRTLRAMLPKESVRPQIHTTPVVRQAPRARARRPRRQTRAPGESRPGDKSERRCAVCSEPIDPARRADALTCSGRCRVRRHRNRHRPDPAALVGEWAASGAVRLLDDGTVALA